MINGEHYAGAERVQDLLAGEFTSGQNIYVTEFTSLARVVLALLGEPGRRLFLELVGQHLDAYADIHHRRAWARKLSLI